MFKDTSCWDITYDHYCPVDQPEYDGSEAECRKYDGGNFLFSGSAEQIIDEGECITASPTISPSLAPVNPPTSSPTATPTVQPTSPPTSGPTNKPTAVPTTVPTTVLTTAPPTSTTTSHTTYIPTSTTTSHTTYIPTSTHIPTSATTWATSSPTDGANLIPPLPPLPPSCPEDVELIKTNGVTKIDLGKAVHIVSQADDKSTVTVRLNQAWTSGTVDHIFYEYSSNPFKSDCTEQTDVSGGAVYTPEDITIKCMKTKPIAEIGICVADAGGGFLNPIHDGATVPKCCHPDFNPSTPVVCYKVLLRCESRCSDAVARRGLRGAGKFLD